MDKIDLIELFVCLEHEQLHELGIRLQISLDENMNRGDLTRAILVGSKLSKIMSVFKKLADDKFIVVVDWNGRILGPLGVTELQHNDFINAAMDLIQYFKNLEPSIVEIIAKKAKIEQKSKSGKTQEFLSTVGSNKAFGLISNMILSKKILPEPKKFPQKITLDKRYGLRFIHMTPIEALSNFICENFSEGDLKPELNPEYGSYKDMVLAYCIQKDPSEILDNLMGTPMLRDSLTNKYGIEKSYLPSEKANSLKCSFFIWVF